jgi:hypothetical protein
MIRLPCLSRLSRRCPERLPSWFFLLVPLGFGLLSVLLGQDANWDLHNYHRYNPWAFLTGRIGHDLAPAGLQSYFNPLIDLPYYGMAAHLPPRAVGFLFGALHGLNFLLLFGIARRALAEATPWLVPALLALAGCLGATFLSELGNTMGDNTTALLVLGAVAWLLRAWPAVEGGGWRGAFAGLVAGVLAGLGVGLKLTNAPYAVGLAVAVFWALRGWSRPRRASAAAAVLGVGAGGLLGLAATAGYWFVLMWQQFGNPLFPQFNAFFHADLAVEGMVADIGWRPRNPAEWLLFPFVFTLWPRRFAELPIVQLLFPMVYSLFGLWLLRAAWHRRPVGVRHAAGGRPAPGALPAQGRFVLVFLAASYLAWLVVFSIGRYAVAMELLLPLAAWILWHRLAPPRAARWLAVVCIGVAVLVSVGRFRTWGNVPWAGAHYTVAVPPIPEPERSTLLVLGAPIAWVLPDFPPALAFVSLNNPGMPESEGYKRRADAIIASRPGPVYALMLRGGESASSATRSACVPPGPAGSPDTLTAEDCTHALQASEGIAARGLAIDPKDCVPLQAWMGATPFAFQFCAVRRLPKAAPG